MDDPDFTGWHRIEYLLWEQSDTPRPCRSRNSSSDLAGLKTEMEAMDIPPTAVAVARPSSSTVSQGQITGEEDRYSHTDMWDRPPTSRARRGHRVVGPALEEADSALLQSINSSFAEVGAVIGV